MQDGGKRRRVEKANIGHQRLPPGTPRHTHQRRHGAQSHEHAGKQGLQRRGLDWRVEIEAADAASKSIHVAVREITAGSCAAVAEREELLRLLRQHKPAVRERFGVARLSIFGSMARGSAAAASDLDVLVQFDGPGHECAVLRPAVLAGGSHRTHRRSGDGKGAAARIEALCRARPHRCLIRTFWLTPRALLPATAVLPPWNHFWTVNRDTLINQPCESDGPGRSGAPA